jgi:dinuclear metal center YbgI/SA1388 family protein
VVRVGDIARIIETIAPPYLALPGDNCGLQTGSPDGRVRGVLVALDPSPEAVRRAVSARADILVTHHPLFYEPVKRLDPSTSNGAAATLAAAKGVAVYSAHTSLDAAPEGLARELARLAGLKNIDFFPSALSERWFKLAVFVPRELRERVHLAMADAGAGALGGYDRCAFAAPGEGMFRPLAGSRPAIGKKGRTEIVEEDRLEMLVEEQAVARVIEAMKKAHPYEEVAYDLYPLRLPERGGIGCLGSLANPGFRGLARRLAERLGGEARISGRPPGRIQKAAVVPGSGGSYLGMAARLGAQALVTGEVRYHQMLEAEHLGMGIIELGHDRSEMPAVDIMAKALRKGLVQAGKKIRVHTYKRPRTASTHGGTKWNRQ